jgi:hypothetical protein
MSVDIIIFFFIFHLEHQGAIRILVICEGDAKVHLHDNECQLLVIAAYCLNHHGLISLHFLEFKIASVDQTSRVLLISEDVDHAEVAHYQVFTSHHQVLGLEITVPDTRFVHLSEKFAQMGGPFPRLL